MNDEAITELHRLVAALGRRINDLEERLIVFEAHAPAEWSENRP